MKGSYSHPCCKSSTIIPAYDVNNIYVLVLANSLELDVAVTDLLSLHLSETAGIPYLESHDEMREVEFCFQVQLDSYVLHTIFRLPPNLKAVRSKRRDHIFNEMAVRIEGLVIRISGITYEAFLVLLQVADNTVGLWFVQSACRGH